MAPRGELRGCQAPSEEDSLGDEILDGRGRQVSGQGTLQRFLLGASAPRPSPGTCRHPGPPGALGSPQVAERRPTAARKRAAAASVPKPRRTRAAEPGRSLERLVTLPVPPLGFPSCRFPFSLPVAVPLWAGAPPSRRAVSAPRGRSFAAPSAQGAGGPVSSRRVHLGGSARPQQPPSGPCSGGLSAPWS